MYNIYWNLICKNGAWLHCTRFWRHRCQNQLILMNMGTKNNFLWLFSHTKLQKSCVWTIFWCFCPFWSLSDVKLWTGQELGENSTKILFKLHTGFEGHEGEQIMTEFSFFGWTVPLTLNTISSAGNLSSRIFRDEFSSLVSSNCSLQGGTSDGLWSLFLPSLLSLKQFLILPFPLSEAADCVTSVTSFFCFSLHSLPLLNLFLLWWRRYSRWWMCLHWKNISTAALSQTITTPQSSRKSYPHLPPLWGPRSLNHMHTN